MDESSEEEEGIPVQVPPVKAYVLGLQNCLCHRPLTSKKRNEQLTEFQARSWRNFRHAASIRQDDASKFLAKEGVDEASEPRGFFHRSRYQDYTNKTNLSRLEKERDHSDVAAVGEDDEAEHEEQYEPPKKRLTRMSIQQTDLASCLICQGRKKIAGNKYKKEKLSRVEMASGVATLVQAARRLNDKRVLLAIEDGNIDFYAAGIQYHPSCYRAYTYRASKAEPQPVTGGQADLGPAVRDALECVLAYVEDIVIDGHTIVSLRQMHEKLLSLLADSGHASTGCSRGVLKRRIESHFGSRIEFIWLHAANQSLLLLSSTLEKQYLLEAYVKLFKETHKEDLNYDYGDLHNVGAGEQTADKSSLEVFHCAHSVRPDLLSVPDAGAWPPFPDSLSRDMASSMVPTSLYNWLAVVFLDNTVDLNADRLSRLSPVPEAIHGRILSSAQDIHAQWSNCHT